MEYRKLISFGKSSFVVSLPKSWVNKQKLKKGDTLYFDEHEDSLILRSKESEDVEEESEIIINVDGKNINQIQRELVPAYINNFKTIILAGKEIKNKAKEIEPLVQNLIALEIMEQTTTKIVAKDFLNMKDISVNNLLRKMDIITRSMIEDGGQTFQENTYENINHRDKDVNRLSYLIYRAVNYGFRNQNYITKQFKLTAQDLVRYYFLAFHIEAIADEARRVARYMCQIKLNKAKQKQFSELYVQVQQNYLDTMKAYYTNNVNLSHEVAEKKSRLIKQAEDFYLENQTTLWIAYLVDRLKRMVNAIHKLGRLVYE